MLDTQKGKVELICNLPGGLIAEFLEDCKILRIRGSIIDPEFAERISIAMYPYSFTSLAYDLEIFQNNFGSIEYHVFCKEDAIRDVERLQSRLP